MNNNFKDFLNDSNANDQVFKTNYNYVKIHKEKYDDRFIIIYSKRESKNLKQSDYVVSGYYDSLDKILYNSTYEIDDLIPKDNSMSLNYFEKITDKICKEIDLYMADYVISNAEEFRKLGNEKFKDMENWRKNAATKQVEGCFIENDDSVLKMLNTGSSYKLRYLEEFNNKNLIVNYLNNPKEVVEKYALDFIDEAKESLGADLLVYEFQLEYLDKIRKNYNNEFAHIYTNRNILNALKGIEAKSINITIKYNDNELTFKYDYNRLLSELKNATYKGYEYGSNYKKVREFLEDNNVKNENGYKEDSFVFQNITSITYGKKILYTNDISKQEKEIENDDFDLER